MRSRYALSQAPDVRRWLRSSCQPRVLHIFERACNLVNEHREILSIVTPHIGNGPFHLVIEGDIVFSEHLDPQSRITISPTEIMLGDLTIHTTGTELWSPRPGWERLHAAFCHILDRLMKLQTRYSLQQGGLPADSPGFVTSLGSSLADADITSALRDAKKLAGLGAGLTPAGDDVIMGALYAVWIIHTPEVASTLANAVAEAAAQRTTTLSAAWLKSAARGEAGIVWHEFFEALLNAGGSRTQDAINKITAIGATSGMDAWAGFIGTITSYAEKHTCPS